MWSLSLDAFGLFLSGASKLFVDWIGFAVGTGAAAWSGYFWTQPAVRTQLGAWGRRLSSREAGGLTSPGRPSQPVNS